MIVQFIKRVSWKRSSSKTALLQPQSRTRVAQMKLHAQTQDSRPRNACCFESGFIVGASRCNSSSRGGRLAAPEPFDFGGAGRIGLIDSECFDLNARKRALIFSAGIDSYAAVVNVNAPAPGAAFARKISRRSVAEETELTVIAFEEVEVARPNQHIGVGLRG